MNFKHWLLISEEEEKDINLSNPNLTSTIPPLNTSLLNTIVSNPKLAKNNTQLNASVSNPNLTNTKISYREFVSNKRVKQLAIEYIKAKGFAKLPIEFRNFLSSKKMAYRDYKKADGTKSTSAIWYPSDIEVAEKNGLPEGWMLQIDDEKESNKQVEALGIRYTELGTGEYPREFRTFLQNKRRAYQDYKTNKKSTSAIWYPSDIEVAEKNGLPKNWMDSQIEIVKSKNEQKSNDRLKELAYYYGKNGSGPSTHASDKKEASLAEWYLQKKNKNKKESRNNTHEKSYDITWAEIVASSKNWNKKKFPHDLPNDWRIIEPAGEKSLGEKYVLNILTELGIKNDTQHRDEACKNKRCLPFDFLITHNGKKYLEFHGGQHYYPAYFGSGGEEKTDQIIAKHAIDKFEYTKKNDTKKYEHCVKENIPFLVIPYWLDKSSDIIKSTIIEFLNTNQFDKKFADPVVPQNYKAYHDKMYAKYLAELNPTELVEPTKTFEQFLINKNFTNI